MIKCSVCLKQFEDGDEVVKVQAVKDDDGNEIKDAPIIYFHWECANEEYVQ